MNASVLHVVCEDTLVLCSDILGSWNYFFFCVCMCNGQLHVSLTLTQSQDSGHLELISGPTYDLVSPIGVTNSGYTLRE